MTKTFHPLMWVILFATLATDAAAKVVRLYNPWLSYGNATIGKIHLVNYYPLSNFGPQATTNIFTSASGPWLDLTLPTLPAGVANFTVVIDPGNVAPYYQTFGLNGIGGGDMDLGTLLATSDTVWIIPTPLPNGPAKLSVQPPKSVTIMLLNPWKADAGARTPSVRIEGGEWTRMDSVAKDAGWYTTFIKSFSSLNLLFRNSDSSSFFGAMGTSAAPVVTIADSIVGKNDTIWIWNSPEPTGKPRVSAVRPRLKTLMLFNPWQETPSIQKPRFQNGGQELVMSSDPTYCGWYRYQFYDRTLTGLFKGATNGQLLGNKGFGNSTPIDFSAAFAASDTAWVVPAATTGIPTVQGAYTGELGRCEMTLLAATIRDFDPKHPAFEHTTGNGVKGMVQTTLGADGTPQPTAANGVEKIPQ